MSGHRAVAEICKLQGWDTSVNIFDENGNRRPKPDHDKIRLGQRIEAKEARTGEPSPQRIMAERAVECLRAAGSWEEARALCDKADLTLVITDSRGIDDKVRWGGFVKDAEGKGLKVKLSALPKDCSYKALDNRFEGKTKTEKAPASKALKPLTANQAKFHGRQALNAASSFAEAENKLAEKGLKIERQGKTGAYLRFGEGEDQKIKLTALGGKYSLSALQKRYNEKITPNAFIMHESQGKIKQSSIESASKYADRAQDRASSANDRAAAVAAEGVQAKTIAEALDDAQAQAVALDAARKAKAQADKAKEQAAQAEKRAAEAEAREAALRQQIQETNMNHAPTPTPKPTPAPEKTVQKTTVDNQEKIQKPENPNSDPAEAEKALKTENSVNANGENGENAQRPLTLAERVAEARKRGLFGNTVGAVPTGHHGPRGTTPTGHHGPKM